MVKYLIRRKKKKQRNRFSFALFFMENIEIHLIVDRETTIKICLKFKASLIYRLFIIE